MFFLEYNNALFVPVAPELEHFSLKINIIIIIFTYEGLTVYCSKKVKNLNCNKSPVVG